MLMMFSMGVKAEVKVLYGEKGTEKFEGSGGTIEVKQEDSKDDETKVTVTLIVTPSDGYTLAKDNSLEVYAVISPDGASTRALEISGNALKLDCNDFKDISQKRTYTVDIDSKLALWIKKAEFVSASKDGPTRAVDYKYVIINNKGNKAFNYTIRGDITYSSINKEQLCVHPKAKSVLAENFRFYTTEAKAVADANGTIGTSGTDYYTEGTTISGIAGVTDNTFYVRYSLKEDPAIDISGEKLYKIQARNRANALFYIAYQANDKSIRIKSTDSNNDSFLWKIESGDPYDMYIYNLQGTTDHSNGVFTVRNIVNASGESALSDNIYYDDEITSGYNQSTSPMHLQSFILTQGSKEGYDYQAGWQNVWSNSYQIIGAYNAIENKPRDESPKTESYRLPGNMPYYVCVNSSSNGGKLEFYRNWRVEDNTSQNTSQIKFIEVKQTYTFHIINNSGVKAVCASTASELNAGATITASMIPDIIKSPLASNYTFYATAADAAAGSNALTRLPYPSHDVYVRYTTNGGDLDVNGGTDYYVTTAGNYLYASSSSAIEIESSITSTDNTRKWIITGNDAYQLTLQNADNSNYVTYNVSSGEAVPTLSASGSKFFLHQSTNGKYELVAVTTNDFSTTDYYTLGVANNTLKLYSKTNYPLGNDAVQTFFSDRDFCASPVISFDISNNQITIDCATAGASIYYTADGTTPSSSSTLYEGAFAVSDGATIKAIAVKDGFDDSEVVSLTITLVATPTIQNNGNNAISITSATEGATIYYTTDGSTPTTSSTQYTGPLTDNVSNVTIKAIAVKDGMINSAVGSGTVKLQCATPVITRDGMTFSISCSMPTDATLYYTLEGGSEVAYTGTPVSFTSEDLPMTVTAVARHSDYTQSETASMELLNGTGTPSDPYLIYGATDFANFVSDVNAGTTSSACYKLETDISASGTSAITTAFSGTFDGGFHKISDLDHALFNSINGGTVKNIILDNVKITTGTNVGAIANEVIGTSDKIASIYNCGILSGSVSGSGYVGGLVGQLGSSTADNCYARVINCYSYANVKGGSVRAGIVGYNSYASKYNDLKTMVMNCMFYGDIDIPATAANLYPIYGGSNISNDYNSNTDNRLNNYNYFLYEAPYSENRQIVSTSYNSALAAEERFLVRFEFYRHLLNSTRELAAWYATGNAANGRGKGNTNKMAKWVLDKSIAPYPILKEQGSYPSVVNYDPVYTNSATGEKVLRTSTTLKRDQGKDLGTTLTITIQESTSGYGQSAPSGAKVVTASLTLPRIDKDTLNYNYNYDKVQLPYYNDVGTGNYTGNRVVTGWKIVSMDGGTSGDYSEDNYDAPHYNYADRDHYGKDIYPSGTGNSGRIFSQGAYFNVPKGVTGITIEPYWGIAAYLSDACYDRYGYYNDDDLTQIGGGQRYTNNTNCPVLTGEQKVYTTASGAIGALTGASGTPTVYDYAVVLVGNYHHHTLLSRDGLELSSGSTPFTIMSIDLNEDNEPDYCLIYRSGKNKAISPIRFDFITVPGMVMAHKMSSHEDLGIPGNCAPKGWFEITTTGLIKYGQFEHSYNGKSLAPLIFMGGVIDQFVANNTGAGENFNNKTKYMLFGDNVWFKMLSNGAHMDKTSPTPHRPISLVGGEYEYLYLSGFFRPDATACTTDGGDNNAECYIDGGKFGEVAGAGQEDISGSITWLIDHADIKSFYGGGLKVVANGSQITGDINTTIKNSYVDLFCGGPKFGDMAAEKTVITLANDCVFGTYFGAGYGGTSIYRKDVYNEFTLKNYSWDTWVSDTYDKSGGDNYRGKFTSGRGVACGYEYEFFAGAQNNVGRLYIKYASFSLAQTNNVTSELTGCTIKGNFYGGGSLGKVAGTATSSLDNCTVNGSVFGAGYSANTPTANIMATGGFTIKDENGTPIAAIPNYNEGTGIYEKADYPSTSVYTWTNVTSLSDKVQALTDDNEAGTHTIKTTGDLEGLGRVTGKVTLNITGNTLVKGNNVSMDNDGFVVIDATTGEPVVVIDPNHIGGVFGGGDSSDAEGDTEVNINTSSQQTDGYNAFNVFGGGNNAEVYGNTVVNLNKGVIQHDVFGGGNKGVVHGSATVNIEE